MAKWVKVLVSTSDNPSLSPTTHVVRRDLSSDLHIRPQARPQAHTLNLNNSWPNGFEGESYCGEGVSVIRASL